LILHFRFLQTKFNIASIQVAIFLDCKASAKVQIGYVTVPKADIQFAALWASAKSKSAHVVGAKGGKMHVIKW